MGNACRQILVGLSFAAVTGAGPAYAADALSAGSLQRLNDAAAPISVIDGSLRGAGAATLANATANAHYVLVGEDHGTVETPRFCDALFALLAKRGFNTLALETGPLVAHRIETWATATDGARQFSAFEAQYPGTTAFYSWREEFSFLRRARANTRGRLHIWGLDQELMGAPGFILDSIMEEHPGRRSTELVRALRSENDADYRAAAQTGSPADTFMVRVPEVKLEQLQESLRTDGNARARALAQSFLDTYRIYQNCCNERAQKSNTDRASLMKRTFEAYLHGSGTLETPKVMFKFGEEHMYRGFNPNRYLDLGDFVAERADGTNQSSVHILVLGAGGTQTVFAGIGKPWRQATYSLFDAEHERFHFLQALVAHDYPGSWTLYDLRSLRSHFNSLGIADGNFERLVFGYDFLVLVPKTTADEPLDPNVF